MSHPVSRLITPVSKSKNAVLVGPKGAATSSSGTADRCSNLPLDMLMMRTPESTATHTASVVGSPIHLSARQCVDDGVLIAKLRSRLKHDSVTKAYVIKIETFDDAVILSGYVELATVRVRTLQIAQEITGSRVVKDLLEIREV